ADCARPRGSGRPDDRPGQAGRDGSVTLNGPRRPPRPDPTAETATPPVGSFRCDLGPPPHNGRSADPIDPGRDAHSPGARPIRAPRPRIATSGRLLGTLSWRLGSHPPPAPAQEVAGAAPRAGANAPRDALLVKPYLQLGRTPAAGSLIVLWHAGDA